MKAYELVAFQADHDLMLERGTAFSFFAFQADHDHHDLMLVVVAVAGEVSETGRGGFGCGSVVCWGGAGAAGEVFRGAAGGFCCVWLLEQEGSILHNIWFIIYYIFR